MTTADIARLRELLSKASAGPWGDIERRDCSGGIGGAVYTLGPNEDPWDSGQLIDFSRAEDAALIAAAVNSLAELLDSYEAAMAVVRAVASANLVDYACGASRCALCGVDLRNEEMDEHDHSKHAPGCAWVAAFAMSEEE